MDAYTAVAVINSDRARTAIWHVDVGPGLSQMGRLCGAWVTNNNAVDPQVLIGRPVFPIGAIVPSHIEPLLAGGPGLVDVRATLDDIQQWIAAQNKIHTASRTEKGNARAPIVWEPLPAPLEWAALPAPPTGVVDDELIADTIVAASWLGHLAAAWAAIETNRLSRRHLQAGDFGPRPLPLALTRTVLV